VIGGSFNAATRYDYWSFNLLDSGEAIYPRMLVSSNAVTSASQRLRLIYFRARRSGTVTGIRSISGGTAAGATPSLCKIGVYTVDPDTYAATLAAATANDTSLWSAANTEYAVALASSLTTAAGSLYAWATLCVTTAATPTLTGQAGPAGMAATSVRGTPVAGFVDGQTDLPSTIALASLTGSGNAPYGELVP